MLVRSISKSSFVFHHREAFTDVLYRDRFRTLQFNLTKVDRVLLHKRIVSGQILPKEISTMSSTDLADEDTKQSIKIAEQEALEHSILQKSAAPRAKITHKGLQDIEDVNGGWRELGREREREADEQQRMERERSARLRAAQQSMARQRTASVSVPPESPISPQTPSAPWGAPPPPPSPAYEQDAPRPHAFEHATTEPSSEPELNLADLINIDDDPMVDIRSGQEVVAPSPGRDSRPATPSSASPIIGISPFASRPSQPEAPKPSFDLNAIWGPSEAKETEPDDEPPAMAIDEPMRPVEPETTGLADDQDFDMFLEEKEPERPMSPHSIQAAFDALPPVWTGKVNVIIIRAMFDSLINRLYRSSRCLWTRVSRKKHLSWLVRLVVAFWMLSHRFGELCSRPRCLQSLEGFR